MILNWLTIAVALLLTFSGCSLGEDHELRLSVDFSSAPSGNAENRGVRFSVDNQETGYVRSHKEATVVLKSGKHRISVADSVQSAHQSWQNELWKFEKWSDGVTTVYRELDLQRDESLTAIYRPETIFSMSSGQVVLGSRLTLTLRTERSPVTIWKADVGGCATNIVEALKPFTIARPQNGKFTIEWQPDETGPFTFTISNQNDDSWRWCLTGHVGKYPDLEISIEPGSPEVGEAVKVNARSRVEGWFNILVGDDRYPQNERPEREIIILWSPQLPIEYDIEVRFHPADRHHVDDTQRQRVRVGP